MDAGRVVRHQSGGFTIIEMLAVMLVILLLAGLMLGVAGYVSRKIGTSTTRAQIAAIESALSVYKSDWGYYPKTLATRISVNGLSEASNNWYMYRALVGSCVGCTRKYMSFPPTQIRTNYNIHQPTICDFWGGPLNYYNSPLTSYSIGTNIYIVAGVPIQTNLYGYMLGGQVNSASYDLFSYGPDKFTYVPGVQLNAGWDTAGHLTYNSGGSLVTNVWMQPSSALDDITNFKR